MGPHKILLAAVIALLPSSTSFRVPTRAARFKDNNSLRVERRGHSPSSSSYADRRDLSRRFYSSPYEPEPEQLELIDIIGPAVIESLSQAGEHEHEHARARARGEKKKRGDRTALIGVLDFAF